MTTFYYPIVWGAAECRKFCRIDTRSTFKYWRAEARGDDRFPEPFQRINAGATEVWWPDDVMGWWRRTREQRGFGEDMKRIVKE